MMTNPDSSQLIIQTLAAQTHIRGLIFDFDGTLADTIPSHVLAFQEVFADHAANVPLPYLMQLSGLSDVGIFERINRDLGFSFDPVQSARRKEQLFLEKYLDRVQPIEPVVAIARHYHNQLALAVATGSVRGFATRVLTMLGLSDCFTTLVAVDDVQQSKPAPDIFLEAARRLALPPAQCHVFEDAELGLEAARRAGMGVTDVRPLIKQWRREAENALG